MGCGTSTQAPAPRNELHELYAYAANTTACPLCEYKKNHSSVEASAVAFLAFSLATEPLSTNEEQELLLLRERRESDATSCSTPMISDGTVPSVADDGMLQLTPPRADIPNHPSQPPKLNNGKNSQSELGQPTNQDNGNNDLLDADRNGDIGIVMEGLNAERNNFPFCEACGDEEEEEKETVEQQITRAIADFEFRVFEAERVPQGYNQFQIACWLRDQRKNKICVRCKVAQMFTSLCNSCLVTLPRCRHADDCTSNKREMRGSMQQQRLSVSSQHLNQLRPPSPQL